MKLSGTQIKSMILLASVMGALTFLAYGPDPAAVEAANAGKTITGPAEIYAAHCAKCHGGDGRARTTRGRRVGATDLTSDWNADEGRGIRIITNGKGDMPSFKRKLTPNEIRAVFRYVLRFRK